MAQAYLGLRQEAKVNEMIPKIKKLSKGAFDLDTFNEQNKKLIDLIERFNNTDLRN